MSGDPALLPQTQYELQSIAGTAIRWRQPSKILPLDPLLRAIMAAAEERFEARLERVESEHAHLPSRVRSLLWIAATAPLLRDAGFDAPEEDAVNARVQQLLPAARQTARTADFELAS